MLNKEKNKKKKIIIKNIFDFDKWVKNLLDIVYKRQVIVLSGPLGAGKTEFVKIMLKYLNVRDVSSPTFTLHKQYSSSIGKVDHFDLYRLKDEEELENIYFWDLFNQEKGLILIEWGEKININFIPSNWSIWIIHIDYNEYYDENIRIVKFTEETLHYTR